jgi:hypothetical protein
MTNERSERRRSARVSPKGTVIIQAGDHAQRGRLANLGGGGLLATTDVTASERMLARKVDLELRLDSQASEWLLLTGRVLRIGANSVAVGLIKPDSFKRLLTRSDRFAWPSPYLVSRADRYDPERRLPIAAFRAAGCAVGIRDTVGRSCDSANRTSADLIDGTLAERSPRRAHRFVAENIHWRSS